MGRLKYLKGYVRLLTGLWLVVMASCLLVAAQDSGIIPALTGATNAVAGKDANWLFAAATLAALALTFWLIRKLIEANENIRKLQEKQFEIWSSQIKVQDSLVNALSTLSSELKSRPCFTGKPPRN